MPEFKQEDLAAEDYEELVKRLYLPEIPTLEPINIPEFDPYYEIPDQSSIYFQRDLF